VSFHERHLGCGEASQRAVQCVWVLVRGEAARVVVVAGGELHAVRCEGVAQGAHLAQGETCIT
jgi:hypothetical protein